MRTSHLFGERATIHDVVHAQRESTQKALNELPGHSILIRALEELIAEFVERFHLSVPVVNRKDATQLPIEEVDVNVSGDFRRPFLDPSRPYFVKGTAIQIAVPFEGAAVLFKYGISPLNSPIPAEVRRDTIVLSYLGEQPDVEVVRKEFENRLDRIENMLEMVRGPAEEWNRELPKLVRDRLVQRRSKLERDQGLNLGYPEAAPKQPPVGRTIPATPKVRRRQEYDLFLSHASEDKEAIARPLYAALAAENLSVWFDEAVLKLGDSLRRKIDEGLAKCRYGVVILSPTFLNKQWPQRELDGLVARETASGEKAILPIWHDLDRETLLRYSPPLADRFAGRSEEGVPALVRKILEVVRK